MCMRIKFPNILMKLLFTSKIFLSEFFIAHFYFISSIVIFCSRRRWNPTTSHLSSKLEFTSPVWNSKWTAYIPATYRHWQFWSCECAVQRWKCTVDSPRKPIYWKLSHWFNDYFMHRHRCVRFKLTVSIYSYCEQWYVWCYDYLLLDAWLGWLIWHVRGVFRKSW